MEGDPVVDETGLRLSHHLQHLVNDPKYPIASLCSAQVTEKPCNTIVCPGFAGEPPCERQRSRANHQPEPVLTPYMRRMARSMTGNVIRVADAGRPPTPRI